MIEVSGVEIHLSGNFNIYKVGALRKEFIQRLNGEFKDKKVIKINLEKVTDLDYSALQVLVSLLKSCKQAGCELEVTKANSTYQALVEVCQLQDILPIPKAG